MFLYNYLASNRRVLRSRNLQESSNAIDSEAVETVVSEADKIAARLAARDELTELYISILLLNIIILKNFDYVVKLRRQKKNKKKNPVLEQFSNEKISETHDKPDNSNDITDEAALATLGNTSSSTTISRSIDTGMENKIFFLCSLLLFINIFSFIIDSFTVFNQQIISGVKRVLEQNKEIYKAIHENKAAQESFRKEIREKIGDLSEKIEQLITPDDSYWKVNSNIIFM